MKEKSNLRNLIFAAGSSLLAVSSASAGQIWDGGSGIDSFWNTADNWDSNTLPTFGSAITFTGTTRATNVNDLTPDTTIGGINFTNTTAGQAFSISGARFTLGGNITTSASSGAGITDTVSLAMILNGNREINTGALHNLTLSGIISETGGARTLTKSGTGTLTLSGDNSYTGVTTISAGNLVISHNNALGTNAGNTNITAAGTGPRLLLSGGINSAENISIGGSTESGSYDNVFSSISGTNTLSGNITLASPGASGIRLGTNGGNLTLAGTINQSGTARTLILNASVGDITVNNAISNGTAALNIISQAASGSVTLKAAQGAGGNVSLTNLSGVWSNTTNGGNETWSFSQATGDLTLTVIPEPSTALLGGLSLLALLRRRRG
jgi:autotransporter-associated beta strand protein